MASNSVLLAINSLPSDGTVHLGTKEHAQFVALVEDYFNASDDGSDDDSSGSDDPMECGKLTLLCTKPLNNTQSNYKITVVKCNLIEKVN